MTRNIAEQLESIYARASMHENAKRLRSAEDWQRVQDIEQRRAHARETEVERSQQDYTARVADARDAILNDRAQWHYTHPAPQSAARRDRFDKDQIERQAHLRVHNAHYQIMAKIDVQANREIKQLMQKNQQQSQARPQSHTQIFNQAQSGQPTPYHQIKRSR